MINCITSTLEACTPKRVGLRLPVFDACTEWFGLTRLSVDDMIN